jgi:hypothetical protein
MRAVRLWVAVLAAETLALVLAAVLHSRSLAGVALLLVVAAYALRWAVEGTLRRQR